MTHFASSRVGIVKNVSDNAITIELPDTGAHIEWPVPEADVSDFEPGESVSLELKKTKKVMNDVAPPAKQENDEEAARRRDLLQQLLN